MEQTGRVIAVLPPKSGATQRGDWKIQEYVIETQGQYPKKMMFTVFGEERINRFNVQIGQDVTVSFDIDAREWNGRWFNEVRAYDVRPSAGSQPWQQQGNVSQAAPTQTAPQYAQPQPPTPQAQGVERPLPF